jgi:hypothetical protein
MKATRENSLAITKTTFGLSPFIRHNTRCGGLAAILVLSALHFQMFVPPALAETPTVRTKGGGRQWSVQVDKVNFEDVSLDPSFRTAIDENLLAELAKTKQFQEVLGSDDRKANDVPHLLILKTTVEEYPPGSKTHRASLDDDGLLGVGPRLFLRLFERTTVSGATKLNVRIQLYTREGRLVLEDVVGHRVQSIGNNLRATQKLAHNVAGTLKRSSLPEPATAPPEQETAKTSKY